MGCGCGKSKQLEAVRIASAAAGKNGYSLSSYPDCAGRHMGKFIGETVFVVARNTPDEKVFNRKELAEASSYSKSLHGAQYNVTIEQLATAEICDEAVLDAYARI